MTKKSDASLLAIPVAIIVIGGGLGALVLVGLPTTFLWAYVLKCLWGWFVAPQFGLPLLPFWNAVGLLLIGGIFTHDLAKFKVDDEVGDALKRLMTRLAGSTVGALLTLGIGYWFSGYVS